MDVIHHAFVLNESMSVAFNHDSFKQLLPCQLSSSPGHTRNETRYDIVILVFCAYNL